MIARPPIPPMIDDTIPNPVLILPFPSFLLKPEWAGGDKGGWGDGLRLRSRTKGLGFLSADLA
jgi:hypothetical protein